LLNLAQAESRGQPRDQRGYANVMDYIAKGGFGKLPAVNIPDSHTTYAKQFAEAVNKDPASYGLQRLQTDNPYDAPPGAVVVIAPGGPGAPIVSGSISVASGKGDFYNGGDLDYGGRESFPPGNQHVLGIYVPQ
jgi:hypothetical protein